MGGKTPKASAVKRNIFLMLFPFAPLAILSIKSKG